MRDKPIVWLGDSRDRLRKFPESARREIGYQLAMIQIGGAPRDWRPMPQVGAGTIEIRIHVDGEYRVFYVAKFEESIYVLHVFAKKSRKAPLFDIELGRTRYREIQEKRKRCE